MAILILLKYALGILLLILGEFIIFVNWLMIIEGYLFKKKCGSSVPFMGGVLAATGLLLIPETGKWWIVALLAAPGGLHMAIISCFYHSAYETITKLLKITDLKR